MNKQLTQQQIDHLFTFVEDKNVPWPDVQAEIVDHLASDIEQRMSQDDSLTYHRALDQVYGQFPITGFVHMIEERKTAIKKYWKRRLVPILLSYLKPPQVFIIIALSVSLYFLFGYLQSVTPAWLWLPIITVTLVESVLVKLNEKAIKENPYHALLFADILNKFKLGSNLTCVLLPALMLVSKQGQIQLEPIPLSIFVVYMSTILVFIHAQIYRFPELIKDEFESKYTYLAKRLQAS